MRSPLVRSTDLKHYFEIKSDLNRAARDERTEDVAHHVDELQILAKYCDSPRLERACAITIARYIPMADAVA